MTQVFLGKDIIKRRDSFVDLPTEFFNLIDPDGTNTIAEVHKHEHEYRCVCYCKLLGRTAPFEIYVTFPEEIYDEIVYTLDISSLGRIN